MKKIILMFVVVFLFASLPVHASKYSRPDSLKNRTEQQKAPFYGWDKLDSAAKDIWLEWKKNNGTKESENEMAEIMVRTTVPVKKIQRRILNIIGFKTRSVIPYKGKGSILTGSMPVRHLDELAVIDFVDHIEAAVLVRGKESPKAIK